MRIVLPIRALVHFDYLASHLEPPHIRTPHTYVQPSGVLLTSREAARKT